MTDWFAYEDAYSLRSEIERLRSLYDQLGIVRLAADENVAVVGIRVAGVERGAAPKKRATQ